MAYLLDADLLLRGSISNGGFSNKLPTGFLWLLGDERKPGVCSYSNRILCKSALDVLNEWKAGQYGIQQCHCCQEK
jgi:hypothetical protein